MTRAHKGWSLDGVILHNDMTKWLKDDITQPPAVSENIITSPCYPYKIKTVITFSLCLSVNLVRFRHPITVLRYADKCIVDIMKVCASKRTTCNYN